MGGGAKVEECGLYSDYSLYKNAGLSTSLLVRATAMALRWGILGAGKIAHDFVVGLRTLPKLEHQVEAVAEMALEPAQRFATTHSIPRYYGSFEELMKDEGLDIIYIATIHVTHLDIGLKVLEAGKPVLCEKPMTMNARDTKALIHKAREKGLFLMEATWMRFFPAVVELRRMIAEGDIGEVKFVRANFSFRRPPDRAKGRLTDPKLGGGSILDVGIYTISFATMLFGAERPEKIYAQGSLLPTGVDDLAAMTLTYSHGRIAQLSCSISYDMSCDAVVCGTKGELRLPHPFWCPTKLTSPESVYEKETVSKEYPLPTPYLPGNYPNCTGLRYEAQEVYTCLKEGRKESRIMPLDESLVVIEIAEEVMRQIGVVYYRQ